MSNLVAFNSVLERAMRVESNRKSFGESLTVSVPTTVILFSKSHIDLLEEQQAKMQRELVELRAIVSATKKPEPRESSFGIA